MTVDNKLELMQIALEVYKIEAKNKGNHQASFFSTYGSLENIITGNMKSLLKNAKITFKDLSNLPTAEEYFNNKKQ